MGGECGSNAGKSVKPVLTVRTFKVQGLGQYQALHIITCLVPANMQCASLNMCNASCLAASPDSHYACPSPLEHQNHIYPQIGARLQPCSSHSTATFRASASQFLMPIIVLLEHMFLAHHSWRNRKVQNPAANSQTLQVDSEVSTRPTPGPRLTRKEVC
eukprot:scaffold118428_cov17-Tisochrysis_lutea.AAC.1